MNIVILDDSKTVRMTICAYLNDLGVLDGNIHQFDNGHKALEYIKNNGADLIFSDIHMPDMSGYEFAKEVFLIKPGFHSSFFAVTASETSDDFKKMKNVGVHRFLKKPLSSDHFNHFIEQEIRKFISFKQKKGE